MGRVLKHVAQLPTPRDVVLAFKRAGAVVGIGAAIVAGMYAGGSYLSGDFPWSSGSGGGGANWAGTFDCYGSTPNCTDTPPSCITTISQGTSIATTIGNASAGDVICLNASGTSYGSVTLSSVSKSSDVIVRPTSGTVTIGEVVLNGTTNHIRFSGTGGTMNMAGLQTNDGNTNDTFDHIVFTDCVDVNPGSSMSNIVLDHVRLDGLGKGGSQTICNNLSEGRVDVTGGGTTGVVFTVKNSHFGGGGCSDGVQVSSTGVQIGPGNEFEGIIQGSCGPSVHADTVQCNGADGLILIGNYFHDNGDGSGGLMCGAGYTSFHENDVHVLNNVFVSDGYPWSAHLAGSVDNLVQHNIMAQHLCLATQNGNAPSGNIDKDNVFWGSTSSNGGINGTGCESGGSCGCTATFNMNPGTSYFGTGSVNATPVFVSNPATGYYHYELDPSSSGYHVGSDGKSMGICDTCG